MERSAISSLLIFYAHSTAFFHLCSFRESGCSIAHANTFTFANALRRYSHAIDHADAPAYANTVVSSYPETYAVSCTESHAC